MKGSTRLYSLVGFAIFLTLFLLGLTTYGYYQLERWGKTPLAITTPVELTLSRGEGLRSFGKKLEQSHVISHHLLFEMWVRLFSDYARYQAGSYRIEPALTLFELDAMIRKGEIFQPVLLELTIPEGFTAEQILHRAAEQNVGTTDELRYALLNTDWRSRYPQLPERTGLDSSLEGYLFPATYRFTEFPEPEDLFVTLLNTFFEKLPAYYVDELQKIELSLDQGVTLASLIERETRADEERPIVSDVIHNRLKRKMVLGIDASIIYGIKDFDGNLRYRHLQDKQNSYNTRIHPGLPPTPICSPGLPSLEAVVSPSGHGYLYYVVDADDFSKHRFAKKLSEHNQNVKAYWKAKRIADAAAQK